MAVVVGEMVSEAVSDRAAPASDGGGGASPRDREIDRDKLEQCLARRAHRAERLWAD